MAENENNIPVKEQEDGSALVALEQEKDHFPEDEKEPKQEAKESDEDDGDEDEGEEVLQREQFIHDRRAGGPGKTIARKKPEFHRIPDGPVRKIKRAESERTFFLNTKCFDLAGPGDE